jgi:hypothetical protein
MRRGDTPVISLLTFTPRPLNQISKWTQLRCNMRFTSKLVTHSYAPPRTRNASYCELFGTRAFSACFDRFRYYARYVRRGTRTPVAAWGMASETALSQIAYPPRIRYYYVHCNPVIAQSHRDCGKNRSCRGRCILRPAMPGIRGDSSSIRNIAMRWHFRSRFSAVSF